MSLRVLMGLMIVTGLTACGGAKPAKPVNTYAKITAAADVNPNSEGRASPVHIRIFQLKEPGAFLKADYWSLVEKEQETLGSSLLQRREDDLGPGEQKEFELKIDPEARVLAVMAELANYRNAHWRTVAAAPGKSLMDIVKKDRVLIGVQKDRVTLEVGD